MKVQKRPEVWCAVAILVCFFLPWVSIGGILTIPGYRLPEVARGLAQLANSFTDEDASTANANLWLYLVYVVPLLSLGVVAMASANKSLAVPGTIAGSAPLALFAFALAERGTGLFEILSVGVYFTLVAAIALIVFAQGFVQQVAPSIVSRPQRLVSLGVSSSLLLVALVVGVVAHQARIRSENRAAAARAEEERAAESARLEQRRRSQEQMQHLQTDLENMRRQQADLQRVMNQ